MSQDHRDPQLDADYQRASHSEAGRPAASTRAAIMREAAAAARRRAPAANDSRYLWRAVAGLAVIGVAVLVWRQTDVRMPGEAPQMTVAAEAQGDVVAASRGVATAPLADAAPPPAAEAVEPLVSSSIANADARNRDARAMNAEQESGRVPDPEPADRAAALAEAPVDTPRRLESQAAADMVLAAAPLPPPPPPAVQARVADPRATTPPSVEEATRLLREHFPAQFASAQPHRLWLVRDADGQVLLSGELEPGQNHEDLRPQLRGLQGSTPGPWQVRQLRNDAGQLIELAIAEVELGEPRR